MEYKGRKYRNLYVHLRSLSSQEWKASFADVEVIIDDNLPASAWDYQAWWANDATHSQGAAWLAAGWETAQVDMGAETVLFRRNALAASRRGNRDPIPPSRTTRPKPNALRESRQDTHTMDGEPVSHDDPLDALDQLQTALATRGVDLAAWARNVQAERCAIDP